MDLAVPLTRAQIDAAGRLHQRLTRWWHTDAALDLLHTRIPGYGPEAVLIKASTLNALYGTNVYAIARMAEHVGQVMADTDPVEAGLDLAERIARLPPAEGRKQYRFHSFAAKFCHFFVNSERFPILDWYAEEMVRYHLGETNLVHCGDQRYVAFVENATRLAFAGGLPGPTRDLDRYLWLAGVYRYWLRTKKRDINSEILATIERPSGEDARDIRGMMGDA